MKELFDPFKLDQSPLLNKVMASFLFLMFLPFALICEKSSWLRYYIDDLVWDARYTQTYNRIEGVKNVE